VSPSGLGGCRGYFVRIPAQAYGRDNYFRSPMVIHPHASCDDYIVLLGRREGNENHRILSRSPSLSYDVANMLIG
jgi:hypothetical protein